MRTLLGAMECLRHGITTIQDMNSLVPQDEETLDVILGAYAEVGIRVVFSIAVRDIAALDIEPFLPQYAAGRRRHGRLASPETLRRIWHSSRRRSSGSIPCRRVCIGRSALPARNAAQLHCSKELPSFPTATNCRSSRMSTKLARNSPRRARTIPNMADRSSAILSNVGLLTERTTLAHSIYITNEEIEDVARAGAGVVHNPLANLKLKNGVAPLLSLKRAGINLALGCDNCSCSDCQNLFQSMKLFTLLAGGMDAEPTGILACDAIEAATAGGARAVGLAAAVGDIQPGMIADLALIDLTDLAYLPLNSVARQLVFSETGRGVQTVLVDGRVVLKEESHDDGREQIS